MKKILVASAVALYASIASAAISGSSHDFRSKFGASAAAPTCAFCHMPHNGSVVAGAPLFARNINYTLTGYVFYSSVVGGQTGPSAATLNAGSRACLSCHDGLMPVATVLGPQGGTTSFGSGQVMTGAAVVGPNMSNDHPISITYTSAGANIGGLVAPATATTNGLLIVNGMVECISCHNAHSAANAATSYPNRRFMRSVTVDFCGACHGAK